MPIIQLRWPLLTAIPVVLLSLALAFYAVATRKPSVTHLDNASIVKFEGVTGKKRYSSGEPFVIHEVRIYTEKGFVWYAATCTGPINTAVQLVVLVGPQLEGAKLDTETYSEGTIFPESNKFTLAAGMPVEYSWGKGELYAFLVPYDAGSLAVRDRESDITAVSNIYHGQFAR